MSLHVHHLNCGTHCPLGGALFDGTSRGLLAKIPTRCLLVETESGLVLFDTGYGLKDVLWPRERLPGLWRSLLNIQLCEDDTAARQIERAGFKLSDVRHIVMTHLDFDHAGGIEDFPQARVHLLAAELDAARARHKSFVSRQRYRKKQWSSDIAWRTYAPEGEPWFGFDAVRQIEGLPPEILLVPLRGHTLGHTGVAIKSAGGWLLHAGDAVLHRSEVAATHAHAMPPGLAVYQRIMDADHGARLANLQRLRALASAEPGAVDIVCSHDMTESCSGHG